MLDQLENFKHEKMVHLKVKNERNQEQLANQRFMKNEIIDMAERMEQM